MDINLNTVLIQKKETFEMQEKVKRVVLIGMDGLIPDFVQKFVNEGILPNMKRFLEEGCFSECWAAPDTLTPTNWLCLATGAWPSKHEVSSFSIHYEGDAFTKIYSNQGIMFPFKPRIEADIHNKAEFIWEKAIKKGKKCITVNYPGAYPPTDKKLIAIDGEGGGVFSDICCIRTGQAFIAGAKPGELSEKKEGDKEKLFGVVEDPFEARWQIPIELKIAEGWQNVPSSHRTPLESCLLETGESQLVYENNKWSTSGEKNLRYTNDKRIWIYTYAAGDNYDTVCIAEHKDCSKPLATLKVGGQSDWIYTVGLARFKKERLPEDWDIKIESKLELKVKYHWKLTELSPDGSRLVLKRSALYNPWGWTNPPEFAEKLIDNVDSHEQKIEELVKTKAHADSIFSQVVTPVLLDTFCHTLTIKKVINLHPDWDLLYTQIHAPDTLNHDEIFRICPTWVGYKEKEAEQYWQHFRDEYKALDTMLGEIMKSCDDGKTVFVVVSDHGAVAVSYKIWVGKFLRDAGLTVYEETSDEGMRINISKSRAIPGNFPLTPCIWVNLKGRDPEGIVEPADYEKVRDEIIDVLLNIRCPETGQWPFSFVGRREQLKCMGQGGRTIGDILYLCRGNYQGSPSATVLIGPFDWKNFAPELKNSGFKRMDYGQHLGLYPNARTDEATVAGTFLMIGPGIKQGHRRQSPIWTVDVVPTICLLMDIPVPKDCEGKVPLDLFED